MSELTKEILAAYNIGPEFPISEDAELMVDTLNAHLDVKKLLDEHCCKAIIISKHEMRFDINVYGNVFFHPDFDDGQHIRTSQVKSYSLQDDSLYVVQTNNTRYLVITAN